MHYSNLIFGVGFLVWAVHAQDPLVGYSCPASCQLPACKCATRNPPVANPPQFLLLSYDDAIQENIWAPATNLFRNRRNPNGCAAQATFYAQVEYSDPYLLTQWYAMGNEVGDHSTTHVVPFAGTRQELEGMRLWASALGGIPRSSIHGVRFPFRNYSAASMNLLNNMGFVYDTSMAAAPQEKIWPYTLDYGVVTECYGVHGLCGRAVDARGLWEIPMYSIPGETGYLLMDPFTSPQFAGKPEDLTRVYRNTFDEHNRGAHVPFGVYIHPTQFATVPNRESNYKAISDFLDYAMSRPNVWMVTNSQLIEYMKNPVSADQLGSQPYMRCDQRPPQNICNGLGPDSLVMRCNLPTGSFRSCYGCPAAAPSLANPAPALSGGRSLVPDTCDTTWWDPIAGRCLCNSDACARRNTPRPIPAQPVTVPLDGPGSKSTNLDGGKGSESIKDKSDPSDLKTNGARVSSFVGLAVLLGLLAVPVFIFF